MTTTLWLEERNVDDVLRWERIRLVGLGLAMVWAAAAGAGIWLIVAGVVYLAANMGFLKRLQADVIPAKVGIQLADPQTESPPSRG